MIEDDPIAREALEQLLSRHGWTVTTAADLHHAMTALDSAIQWVVLDLMLPDGDGAAVLAQIRRRSMACRVVVVTGVTARAGCSALLR